MLSYKKLMEAQQREWPNSTRLTPHQMMQWADKGADDEQKLIRYMRIASALYFPRVVFYLTASGHIGARYGLEGSQYMSGFNHRAVELRDNRLVDIDRFVC